MSLHNATTLAELAKLTGGRVLGDAGTLVSGAAPIDEATPGDITFIDQADRAQRADTSAAAAVVVPRGVELTDKPCLVCDDVHESFTTIVGSFQHERQQRPRGIHPTAVISPTARLGEDVSIGPNVVVGDDTKLDSRVTLQAGVIVGNGCHLSDDVTLMANVTLYDNVKLGERVIVHAGAALGAYGFGYRQADGRHELTAQLGGVTIGDDVEIGANCTIDRGTYSDTRVDEGTKIDNLVQIAHNCKIGKHNLLCSQVGIAGSTSTGDYVVMAGQVGVRDHVHIGTGATLGAMAGVSNDVADGTTVLGAPAIPVRDFKVQTASIAKLPQLRKQVKELTKLVAELQAAAESQDVEPLESAA